MTAAVTQSNLTKKKEAIRITSSFSIMHDMPRIITCTTSGVLRLLVVYHRCGMCVHAKSVMIARRSAMFTKKTAQYHPPYNHHNTQSRRKVKSLCKMFQQALRYGFLHMLAKAKDLSLRHTWSFRWKRSASEISRLIVEADLVLWLNYESVHSFVLCPCCGGVDSSLRSRSGLNKSERS